MQEKMHNISSGRVTQGLLSPSSFQHRTSFTQSRLPTKVQQHRPSHNVNGVHNPHRPSTSAAASNEGGADQSYSNSGPTSAAAGGERDRGSLGAAARAGVCPIGTLWHQNWSKPVHGHACKYDRLEMHLYKWIHKCIHTRAHTYTYTHTCTYLHIHGISYI